MVSPRDDLRTALRATVRAIVQVIRDLPRGDPKELDEVAEVLWASMHESHLRAEAGHVDQCIQVVERVEQALESSYMPESSEDYRAGWRDATRVAKELLRERRGLSKDRLADLGPKSSTS